MNLRRSLSPALALLLVSLVGCESTTDQSDIPERPSLAARQAVEATLRRHLVVFKQGAPAASDFGAQVAALGGKVELRSDALGFASVSGLSDAAAAKLAADRRVEAVEVEPVLTVIPEQRVRRNDASRITSPTNPAAAFAFSLQWNLRAIHADAAWTAGKLGSSQVMAAILDTGLDYTYPDLAGLVDLALSIDLVNESDSVEKYVGAGRHPITDLNGHGSHVGGTVSSNAFVVAGVTSQTKLVGVKVCTMRGSCPTSAVLDGIRYAADAGAAVINMSLGGVAARRDLRGFQSILNNATNYARRKGSLIVVSAGNSALDLDHGGLFALHCDDANVVCVSATGPTGEGAFGPFVNVDAPALYTNFGRSAVNVAAPGGNLVLDQNGDVVDLTPVWGVCSLTSLEFENFPPAPDDPPLGFFCPQLSIAGFVGTSEAAPHVTGLAALLAAETGGNPAQIRSRIYQSPDDLGQRGTDPFYGKGRINVANALGLN
jgi:subtilisin family serine protease